MNEQDLAKLLTELAKKLYLPGFVAIIGTIIHFYRSGLSFFAKSFLIHTIINIAVVFSTGIICQDYLQITNERFIWVISGIVCSFSTYILNLFQYVITKIAPEFIRKSLNLDQKKEEKDSEM